jgi:predicted nucleic acid-binding protein
MSRIFWDSMLFNYLLNDHPEFGPRVLEILTRSIKRQDALFTSYLVFGELMAGAERSADSAKTAALRLEFKKLQFLLLPFDGGAVEPFSRLRARTKVKAPDAIHLACAASAGIDLFLTGDKDLVKLDVPGIQFIADFTSPVL